MALYIAFLRAKVERGAKVALYYFGLLLDDVKHFARGQEREYRKHEAHRAGYHLGDWRKQRCKQKEREAKYGPVRTMLEINKRLYRAFARQVHSKAAHKVRADTEPRKYDYYL